jgi:hypothetical protein
VHQSDPVSSDLSFNLRLEGILSNPDTDGDGLIDAWELTWFSSLTAQTGAGDADGDGVSNFTEMKARTSPLNVADKFAIIAHSQNAAGQMTLSWPTVSGVRYQVFRSEDLTTWTPLPGVVSGDGTVKSFTDTQAAPTMGKLFYRVGVQ